MRTVRGECPSCGQPTRFLVNPIEGPVVDDCAACVARHDAQFEEERALRAEGYHRCPDGTWRRTPGNGMFDGICGVCESYQDDDPA